MTDIIYNESGDFSAYVYVITPDEENDMLDLGGIEVVFDVYSRLDTVIVPQKAVKKLDGRNYVKPACGRCKDRAGRRAWHRGQRQR